MGKNGTKKKKKSKKAKLIVCSKGSCAKRLDPVCEALTAEIERQGLDKKIKLERKGCAGACDKQPAVQIDKGGRLYTRVKVEEAPDLIAAAKEKLKIKPKAQVD